MGIQIVLEFPSKRNSQGLFPIRLSQPSLGITLVSEFHQDEAHRHSSSTFFPNLPWGSNLYESFIHNEAPRHSSPTPPLGPLSAPPMLCPSPHDMNRGPGLALPFFSPFLASILLSPPPGRVSRSRRPAAAACLTGVAWVGSSRPRVFPSAGSLPGDFIASCIWTWPPITWGSTLYCWRGGWM